MFFLFFAEMLALTPLVLVWFAGGHKKKSGAPFCLILLVGPELPCNIDKKNHHSTWTYSVGTRRIQSKKSMLLSHPDITYMSCSGSRSQNKRICAFFSMSAVLRLRLQSYKHIFNETSIARIFLKNAFLPLFHAHGLIKPCAWFN